jgi:hypothetical protein
LAANSGSLLSHQELTALQIDLVGAQEAPDVLFVDVAERTGQQRCSPVGIARWRGLIEHDQNPLLIRPAIFGCGAAVAGLIEARKTIARVAHPPFRRRSGRGANEPADLAGRGASRRPKARSEPGRAFRAWLLVERSSASSTARSSSVRVIAVASGIAFIVFNHDSLIRVVGGLGILLFLTLFVGNSYIRAHFCGTPITGTANLD